MLAADVANDELGELVVERDGRVVAGFELVPGPARGFRRSFLRLYRSIP